jgi:hypothetical protein
MTIDEGGDPVVPEAHDYRAISLTHEGHVANVRSLVAESDDEAIAQTLALARDLATDLWDGLRFVEHFAGRLVTPGGGLTPAGVVGRI